MTSTFFAFDVGWSVELETVAMARCDPVPGAEVRVRWGTEEECRLEWDGASTVVWAGAVDRPITLEQGTGRDYRFVYGDRAVFHLPSQLDEIRCLARDRDDPAWQRVLFDTVMFSMSLLRGRQMVHAAAVALDRRALVLVGLTGGGKSSLAWELMRRGASLVSDDVVALAIEEQMVLAAPGPPLMNLPAERALEVFSRELAAFPDSDERWVHVRGAIDQPLPIGAFVLLDRRDGLTPSLELMPSSPLALLAHSTHLDNGPNAAASRFRLMADVADRVPVYHLAADRGESPEMLATRLTNRLRADRVVRA